MQPIRTGMEHSLSGIRAAALRTRTARACVLALLVFAPAFAGAGVTITQGALPAASAGSSYAQTLTASGGVPPYFFAIAGGSFPAGLWLSSTGLIGGTPDVPGAYSFTISVTDSSGSPPASGAQTFALTVNPPPPVAGTVAQTIPCNPGGAAPTAVTLALSGGAADSIAILTPPAHGTAVVRRLGITYTPAPDYTGSDSFTYTASNAGGTSAPGTVTLSIVAPMLQATAAVANVTLSESSAATPFIPVTAAGGVAPYTYRISPALPAGLRLNTATGQVSGTPTVRLGSGAYSVQVGDAAGQHASASFHLSILAPRISIIITPTFLRAAAQGAAYSATLSASGGVAPYRWALSGGALPAGLKLSRSGVISGVPAGAVSGATVSVSVTDANGVSASRTYGLAVSARPDPSSDATVAGTLSQQALSQRRFIDAQLSNVSAHLLAQHAGFDACANAGGLSLGSAATAPAADAVGDKPQQAAVATTDADCLSRALFDSGVVALWSAGSIDRGAIALPGANRTDLSSSGLTVGLDYRLGTQVLIGAALGGGWDRADLDALGSSLDSANRSGEVYVQWELNRVFAASAQLGYARYSSNSVRWAAAGDAWLQGSRAGSAWFSAVALQAGLGTDRTHVDPYARVAVVNAHLSPYQEAGAAALALGYAGVQATSESFVAGIALSHDVSLRRAALLTPLVRIEEQRSAGGNPAQALYYSAAPGTAYATRLTAFPVAVTTGEAGLELRLPAGWRCELGVTYTGGSDSYLMRSYYARAQATF